MLCFHLPTRLFAEKVQPRGARAPQALSLSATGGRSPPPRPPATPGRGAWLPHSCSPEAHSLHSCGTCKTGHRHCTAAEPAKPATGTPRCQLLSFLKQASIDVHNFLPSTVDTVGSAIPRKLPRAQLEDFPRAQTLQEGEIILWLLLAAGLHHPRLKIGRKLIDIEGHRVPSHRRPLWR